MDSSRLLSLVRFALLTSTITLLASCGGAGGGNSPTPGPGPAPAPQLAVWSNNFNGVPFTMVGTDPNISGSGTTSVPVVIIPVSFNFSAVNTVISPESISCGDTVSAISRAKDSPIFNNNVWSDGPTVIGDTQFGDAFQRANFWTLVSTVSPNYHVMLQPVTLLSTVVVDVPVGIGAVLNPSPTCPSQPLGGIPIDFMDSVVKSTVASQHLTADTLPIFLTYDMQFLLPAGNYYLGYHFIQGNQTYVVASYMDSGFNGLPNVLASDIAVLSHEIGEWIDNPLGVNFVPPWGRFGIQTTCDNKLEVGDPLSESIIPVATPAFTYHVQELAYFSWFARNAPSLAINGRYSMESTFASPAPPCL